MNIALFDLDNTLLGGDSDHLWGQFLIEQGAVNREYYQRENDRYYWEYQHGTLDIREFLEFSLLPLTEHDLTTLHRWRQRYFTDKIIPIMLPKAYELLDRHRRLGHTLVIITATNRFVTEPIAQHFGVDHLLATDPELIANRYTGRIVDPPCFREGKVKKLELWLRQNGLNLASSWFYSDSHNDIPLLERVTHPCAVDPDDTLAQHASMKGWPVISLRNSDPSPR
ncbi:MAG: HAD family hydrolase [Gammaproteobacteria bacterium]|nr:HAD family hydrolase [Gammaproteobacteria bacterium]